ncbi:hypothetical protein YC2023_021941 [Brassica napus]
MASHDYTKKSITGTEGTTRRSLDVPATYIPQAQKCEYGIERENKTWISQVYAKLYELGCFRGRHIGESIGPTLPYDTRVEKKTTCHHLNNKGYTRHTITHLQQSRPDREETTGEDEIRPRGSPEHTGIRTTPPDTTETLTRATETTSNDSIGTGFSFSNERVGENQSTGVEISSKLSPTTMTKPSHISSTPRENQTTNQSCDTLAGNHHRRRTERLEKELVTPSMFRRIQTLDSSTEESANHQKHSQLHAIEETAVYQNR